MTRTNMKFASVFRSCIRLYIGVLYSPAGGYLDFVHSSTQTKQDIVFKGVILALSWGV